MGIKFNCQTCGKKLNVKNFLAGKRGICPHCGSKIHIPGGKSEPAQATATPAAAAYQASPATPAGAAAGHPGTGSVAPRAVPMGPARSGGMAAPSIASGPAAVAAPATRSGHPDPFSEAPHAVWYVRPASGGQFGPAAGDIMRRWITEGRVAADSLVWREGWSDWKPASSIFPDAAGAGATGAGGDLGGPATGLDHVGSGCSGASYRARPRKSNAMVVAMLIVLAIASVGLLVALLAVLGGFSG